MKRMPRPAGAPLHIGLFSPPLAYINGIVTYVRFVRDALLAEGHRVTVVTSETILDWRGEHVTPPVSRRAALIGNIRGRLSPDHRDLAWIAPRITEAMLYAHARDPFDVVEAEESFGWTERLRGKGMAVVPRLHGPHIFGKDDVEPDDAARRSLARIKVEGRAMVRADALSCPSQRLLDATLAYYGITGRIAEAIPNPMPTAAPLASWRRDAADPDQILCVARFDMRKGADIVLQAFARAAAERPALRLIFAGPDYGVTTAQGPMNFDAFVRAFIPPEVRDRIDYRGNLKPDQVAELRRSSAFSIIGSRFENFPYSLAESMAAGATTIASDSFGNGEMIVDGETGLVVPIGDSDAMARAILALHGDMDRIAAMGAAAQARCRSWLAPDRIARDLVALYCRAGA